jgi:hypothetical protein
MFVQRPHLGTMMPRRGPSTPSLDRVLALLDVLLDCSQVPRWFIEGDDALGRSVGGQARDGELFAGDLRTQR